MRVLCATILFMARGLALGRAAAALRSNALALFLPSRFLLRNWHESAIEEQARAAKAEIARGQ
ncbi:MAG TPA: hypothetical protein VJ770_13125 [Stellaceae bacterium]|nr:hypothetical protein [Stellaceae bacterium]